MKQETPKNNWNPEIHRQRGNNLWGIASVVDAQEVKYFDNHNKICAIQQHKLSINKICKNDMVENSLLL